MKKLTFLCVAVMITAALIFKAENSFSQVYQLENPGFEVWPGSATSEPTSWNSFPSASCELTGLAALGCGTATSTRHQRSDDVRPGSTGQYSCKIYSTSALGITANGALTSGLMHLGSTTATSTKNCNQTMTGDTLFNHRLNAKPDSIVFWAKAVNASDASQSCCHLYIHDNYNLKDPLASNSSGYQSHIVGGVPSYNFTNNGSTWQRHSTPIIYEGYSCNNPQYVLITFSTNATPGGGSAGDALYIDDIEFIYNPIHHEFSETACGSFNWDGTNYTTSGDYTKTYTVGPRDSIVTLHLTIGHPSNNESTINACESYTWNNQTYTTSGDYTSTFTSFCGCDSTVTLHLNINHSVASEFSATECGSYAWNEQHYTESGNYQQTFTAANGCDSVVTLHLTINQPVAWEFAQTACESYTWNGQEYNASGDYTQTFTAANNCDSVVTLHLTINQPVAWEFAQTACESYTWNNETYNASGDYQQTFTAANNCDSVVTLHLTINQPVASEFTQTACGIYAWGEESYTTSGDHIQTFTAANGCDSVVTLHLTITEAPTREESAIACGSYTWYGEEYTQSGDHTHIVPSTNPEVCDSIITLHLTINQPTAYEFSETACSSYTWNGQEYTTSGDHTQTFTAANGCDSVVTLHLTINQPVAWEFAQTACESYTWNNETYNASGDYQQTFTAANNCDSVVTLHLTINQPVAGEFTQTACGIYAWGEESYTTSGDYNQTFTAANGCDSVVTLHLTITEAPTREESAIACGSYTWYGEEYTQSGDHTHIVPSTNTEVCDSIITLHLTVNQPVASEFAQTACESYTWNGHEYTASGDYTQTFTAANNCDSVVTLHLTINTPANSEESVTACSSYTWYGQEYTQSGDFTHIIPAENEGECDSQVTLHLTINTPANSEESATACGSYTWYGQEYTQSGDFTHTIPAENEGECDSQVTLHLTINTPANSEESVTACGSYTWYGQEYTQSGDFTHTIPAENEGECDSQVTLHLTINTPANTEESVTTCDSYTWYGQEYTQSGDFTHTIPAENEGECDSQVTLHLTINNSVTNEITEEAVNSFTWNGVEYTVSGDYVDTLATAAGCDSIVTLHLTITTVGIDENAMTEINVYPVPAKDVINIEGNSIESIRICDILGKEIMSIDNIASDFTSISTENMLSGHYILIIRDENGNIANRRISVMK